MLSIRPLRHRALAGLLGLGALLSGANLWANDCVPPIAVPTRAQVQEAQRNAKDRGFLWEIEKDGKVSHLYGTLHVGKLAWVPPGPKLAQALRSSKVIALEMDLTDPDTLKDLVARSRPPAANPTPLAPDLQARLREVAVNECVPWETLAPMRPMMQLSTLAVLMGHNEGLEAAYGSEYALAAMAKELHLPVRSLETPAEQMGTLNADHAPKDQTELIEIGLDELQSGKARRQMRGLSDAWATNNLERLETYDQWCECANTPATRAQGERIVGRRNVVLADRIDALIAKEGPAMVAVGSLHMTGSTGLPALLTARGYTVKQVF